MVEPCTYHYKIDNKINEKTITWTHTRVKNKGVKKYYRSFLICNILDQEKQSNEYEEEHFVTQNKAYT